MATRKQKKVQNLFKKRIKLAKKLYRQGNGKSWRDCVREAFQK